MSPPSENSEYDIDVEPAAKDNKTTNRLSGTGEPKLAAPTSNRQQSSKTEYYSESEPSPKKTEPNTAKPAIDPVIWKQARVELKDLI